jgi:hypothetical protein
LAVRATWPIYLKYHGNSNLNRGTFGASFKTQVLTEAFDEWLARHSDEIILAQNLGDLVAAALDEFINRHRDEFLPVDQAEIESARMKWLSASPFSMTLFN